MRLAAQAKLGYYPIPSEVVDLILHHLRMPSDKKQADGVCILDPCCGKAVALAQLRERLGVKPERTYAIELDGGRAAEAALNLPKGAHILGPCSFFGSSITTYSMGMVYLNPPFDEELGGGGREETRFLEKVNRLLVPGGILVFVLPVTTFRRGMEGSRLRRMLDLHYEDMKLYSFPDEHRHFKEVVLFGVRRKAELIDIAYHDSFFTRISIENSYRQDDPDIGTDNKVWIIPDSWAPNHFIKSGYLHDELVGDINQSPLIRLLEPPKQPERHRPLLPLSKGHKALLLASGILDGLVEMEGEPPHVVRGSTSKIDYISESSSKTDAETGATTIKTVTSQRPVLTIRVATEDGTMITLSDEVNTEGDEEAEDAGE